MAAKILGLMGNLLLRNRWSWQRRKDLQREVLILNRTRRSRRTGSRTPVILTKPWTLLGSILTPWVDKMQWVNNPHLQLRKTRLQIHNRKIWQIHQLFQKKEILLSTLKMAGLTVETRACLPPCRRLLTTIIRSWALIKTPTMWIPSWFLVASKYYKLIDTARVKIKIYSKMPTKAEVLHTNLSSMESTNPSVKVMLKPRQWIRFRWSRPWSRRVVRT